MTHRIGRNGRRYARAGLDPRGQWAAGVPASAGFAPQDPVQLFSVESRPLFTLKPKSMKLPRQGAQRTRGALRLRGLK